MNNRINLAFSMIFLIFLFGMSAHASPNIQTHVVNAESADDNIYNKGVFLTAQDGTFPKNFNSFDAWISKKQLRDGPSLFGDKFWFVLKIDNRLETNRFVISPYNAIIESVSVQLLSEDSSQMFVTGEKFNNQYAYHYGGNALIEPNESYYLVALFDSNYFFGTPKMVVKPESKFINQTNVESFVIVLCFGIGIALGIYNFFIYLGSQEKSHLYYSGFILCLLFGWAHLFQMPMALFGVYYPSMQGVGFTLSLPLSALFFINFLNLKVVSPALEKFSYRLALVAILGLPAVIWDTRFGFIWVTIVSGVLLVTGLIAGIKAWKANYRPAKYFVLAYLSLLLPNMYLNLVNAEVLPAVNFNLYILGLVGAIIDALLLAFALADRWNILNKGYADLNTTLENKVEKRTAELKTLTQELQKSSEAKSYFVANMSHEIRTPLTSIIGYAESILKGDIAKDKQPGAMDVIVKNGNHLLNLVNDVLDLSKIEAKKLDVEMRDTQLFELLAELESVFYHQAKQKGLNFRVNYQFPLPDYLITDVTRLKQVLFNLMSNAIKFTEKGEVQVDVNYHAEQLICEVKDTGVGMTTEQISHVFNAFQQGDTSTSRRFGGTGLGLNIAKAIAQKLGGDITVESEANKGSIFTLKVVAHIAPQAHWYESKQAFMNRLTKQVESPAKTHVSERISGHVLLADDNADIRMLTKLLLTKLEVKVTEVENGQQAVDAMLSNDFDLVLLDIQMPILDGMQAFTQIRAENADVPIIAMTANAMQQDIESYLTHGFTDHLAKPIQRDIFVQKVTHYLNAQEPTEEELLLAQDMEELQGIFIENLENELPKYHDALRADDIVLQTELTHSIKGSAGMYGFDSLTNMGKKYANAHAANNTKLMQLCFKVLVEEMERIVKAQKK